MRKIPLDHYFTEEEKQFILDHFYDLSGVELSQKLHKTGKQIYCFARQRGLKHILPASCLLREVDLPLFKEKYPYYSNSYLSEKFFPYLTARQITSMAPKIGVSKKQEQRYQHYSEEQLLERLDAAIKKHGRTPLLSEVADWTGIGETSYRNYCGGLTAALTKLGYKRMKYNTTRTPHTIPALAYTGKDGNVYSSISEQKIADIMYEIGLSYQYDLKYSEITGIDEFEDLRFDWYLPAQGKFIEFFGLFDSKKNVEYTEKAMHKIELCKKHNLKLISIYPRQLRYVKLDNFQNWLTEQINN